MLLLSIYNIGFEGQIGLLERAMCSLFESLCDYESLIYMTNKELNCGGTGSLTYYFHGLSIWKFWNHSPENGLFKT